jgi:hypothetical protein
MQASGTRLRVEHYQWSLTTDAGGHAMDALASLETLLQGLSDDRRRQLIDFARFLAVEDERRSWEEFGRIQLARGYGPDEPEYSAADIKPGTEE